MAYAIEAILSIGRSRQVNITFACFNGTKIYEGLILTNNTYEFKKFDNQ
jgi:hypothetical protein